jgi:hypothetical protein
MPATAAQSLPAPLPNRCFLIYPRERLQELGQQYTLVGEAKTTLEKECRQQAKKLQSYQDREQELQDNAVSLEAKTKEIQSRLGAVQLREHESQTMRENLETQAKQIAAQKTEADLLIKTLTAEKTHLESLASTFEKLIIDNTTLQADLQLKASVVNATIEKDPTLQAAVTEKKQQERPLFSVFNATKNSTLDFPPELILVILDLCGFENLKSLLMLNKETNQSMKACINKSPAIFFQKVYPSFISLEPTPVEIFGVPPLDENLFKEPTPVKLLQSLPKVFKHQDTKKQKHYFLPLPYAKDFLGLLKEVAVKHPAIKEIFNAHPLPVWIGPVIKLTPFQTDVTLDEKQNIAVYNALYCDAMDASMTELKGAGTLVRQHPHVLLRTPKDHSILYPYNNRRDTPIARLLRTFLEEFLQPYPVTPIPGQHFTQCVSLCGWIYECMIGYGPGPENLYTKIRTLCNSMEATKQSALQTIHIPSHTNCLNKTIPLVCKEIVLGSGTIKTNNEEEDDDEDTIALYNLHYLLGTRKYGPNSHTREQAHEPIPHNVQILRFLNYSFDQKSVQRIPFAYQNIPHLIIHVPEGWQLTEDIKAALQTRVKNSKTLQSITLMTECKNMNWHASKQLGQFLKTVTPPQTS